MDAPAGASREPRARSAILAAILLAAAAAAVYVLVAIFPTR
jgi:hypothetical protein